MLLNLTVFSLTWLFLRQCQRSQRKPVSSQLTLFGQADRKRKADVTSACQDEAIIKSLDMMTFRIVEKPVFKALLKTVAPK